MDKVQPSSSMDGPLWQGNRKPKRNKRTPKYIGKCNSEVGIYIFNNIATQQWFHPHTSLSSDLIIKGTSGIPQRARIWQPHAVTQHNKPGKSPTSKPLSSDHHSWRYHELTLPILPTLPGLTFKMVFFRTAICEQDSQTGMAKKAAETPLTTIRPFKIFSQTALHCYCCYPVEIKEQWL